MTARCVCSAAAVTLVVAVGLVISPLASSTATAAGPAAGSLTNFGIAPLESPSGMATGPDGNMWVTSPGNDSIVRVTPAGVMTHFAGAHAPIAIAPGPDGAMWFSNSADSSIGRITTAGVMSRFWSPAVNGPRDITTGPDGALWFAANNAIGRITTTGVITTFTAPGVTWPSSIAAGSDGALWFTNYGSNSIGRITTDGAITFFTDPKILAPATIVSGPDGALWFANYFNGTSSIGRITTAGVVAKFGLPPWTSASTLTVGADGALWFGGSATKPLGRMTLTGVVSTFSGAGVRFADHMTAGPDGAVWFTAGGPMVRRITPGGVISALSGTGAFQPTGMALGPDGAMWFLNLATNSVGRVTPAGVVTNYNGPGINEPFMIAAGSDGAMWFTNHGSNSIGRIGMGGAVLYFAAPGIDRPFGITSGPDGALWFTNQGNNTVGRITTAGVVTVFGDPSISYPMGIVTGPDGALWFVNEQNDTIGRITTGGQIASFSGTGIRDPFDIDVGSDDALWFTNAGNGSIGRITTAGQVSNFPGATIKSPFFIEAGADGALWFSNGDGIGRITTAGVSSTFTAPGIDNAYGIAASPDGSMWFVSSNTSSIWRTQVLGSPAPPLHVVGTHGNGSVHVTWDPVGADGGSAITGFTVTASPGGATCATAGARSCTVAGLTNGTPYTFRVTGTNANGTSAPSPTSSPVVPSTTPGAPIIGIADAGNSSAIVRWSAPVSDGGAPITSYTVTESPGGATCQWLAGPLNCIVSNLAPGVPHTFTVRAANLNGSGPLSGVSNAVVPTTRPSSPTAVVATGGRESATVTWAAPVSDGGAPIASYYVMAMPGGQSCTWTSGPRSCVVSGLEAGTSYTFTVNATNVNGTSDPSSASNAVVPWSGSGFHALVPVRVLDSRTTTGGWSGKLNAGVPQPLVVAGLNGVPATARAVVVNVTATSSTTASFLAVWPAGVPQPTSSNVNFAAGETIPNLVTVPIGASGSVMFATAAGATDVVADVVGYFDDGHGPGELFNASDPYRRLDTRTTGNPVVAGATRDITVRAPPMLGTATTAVLNVTVTGANTGSFLTVWPAGVAKPTASNLNFAAGQTIANLVVVKIGAGGKVSIANAVGSADVIVDVVGYFDPTAGARFHPVTPERALDDRVGIGLNGPWTAGVTRSLVVGGVGSIPTNAVAVVANITVTNASVGSFVAVFGHGSPLPASSTLNFGPGQTIANLAMPRIGTSASVDFYNKFGTVDIIADITGYYAPT